MKVLIVHHPTYGHTLHLARAVEEGVNSVAGIEAVFRRAPEFPHLEKNSKEEMGMQRKFGKTNRTFPSALWMTYGKRMAC
jgi:multimeric flavodoxin WrbA